MKIMLKRAGSDAYKLSLGEADIVLGMDDLRKLFIQVAKILVPGSTFTRGLFPKREFMMKMRGANDIGVQALLQMADHDDLLLLLKAGEDDDALTQKLFSNMSENSRKMFAEDLQYKFKEGIPEADVQSAIGRIWETAQDLEADGRLTY